MQYQSNFFYVPIGKFYTWLIFLHGGWWLWQIWGMLYPCCIIILVVSLSSLHPCPCCILILIASLSSLHFYPRCILNLVASLSSLNLYPRCILSLLHLCPHCIFILVASLSSLHLYPRYIIILVAYISVLVESLSSLYFYPSCILTCYPWTSIGSPSPLRGPPWPQKAFYRPPRGSPGLLKVSPLDSEGYVLIRMDGSRQN